MKNFLFNYRACIQPQPLLRMLIFLFFSQSVFFAQAEQTKIPNACVSLINFYLKDRNIADEFVYLREKGLIPGEINFAKNYRSPRLEIILTDKKTKILTFDRANSAATPENVGVFTIETSFDLRDENGVEKTYFHKVITQNSLIKAGRNTFNTPITIKYNFSINSTNICHVHSTEIILNKDNNSVLTMKDCNDLKSDTNILKYYACENLKKLSQVVQKKEDITPRAEHIRQQEAIRRAQ